MSELCASCGAALPDYARFCVQCGTDRPKPGATPPAQPAPIPAAAPSTTASLPICAGCGVIAPSSRQTCVICNSGLAAPLSVADSVTGFWTAVECRFRCTACGHVSPLNHLDFDGSVVCLRCGIDQRFDPEQWVDGLRHAHAVGDLCGPNPQGRFPSGAPLSANQYAAIGGEYTFSDLEQSEVQITGSGVNQHSLAVKAMPGHPLCPKCKAPLAVRGVSAETLDVGCPRCPHQARYNLPPGISQHVSGLSGIVCQEHELGGRDARLLSDASGAVAIRCPNCSAPLSIDGQRTVVHCGYCGIAVRIPAATLRGLGHTDPKAELWWLYFTATSQARAELERRALAEQQEQARRAHAEQQRRLSRERRAAAAPAPAPKGFFANPKRALPVIYAAGLFVFVIGSGLAAVVSRDKPPSTEPAQTEAAPITPAEPAPPPGPKLALVWNGKVSKAEGKALKKGAGCVVKLESQGSAIQWLNASCGDERLYDSRTPVMGMSMRSAVLGEAPHADHPGSFGYAVLFHDTGQRSGRAQVQVDTTHEQAIVFSETIPQFRVEIALDRISQPRTGEPIYKTPKRLLSITRELSVSTATGSSPVKSGQACKLELGFANSLPTAMLCTATLSCGKRWLYGKQAQPGFASCTLDSAGYPLTASDTQQPSADTTPALEVDVKQGSVKLDSSEDGYSVVLIGKPSAG